MLIKVILMFLSFNTVHSMLSSRNSPRNSKAKYANRRSMIAKTIWTSFCSAYHFAVLFDSLDVLLVSLAFFFLLYARDDSP